MRSKTLLVSNILATLYSAILVKVFVGALIAAGGIDYLEALGAYFEFALDLMGSVSDTVVILYAILALLFVHIAFFALGSIIGWIAFAAKKSGGAKFAATLYLLATICFPIFLFFGLPITIIGYVGGSKQKKINKEVVVQ